MTTFFSSRARRAPDTCVEIDHGKIMYIIVSFIASESLGYPQIGSNSFEMAFSEDMKTGSLWGVFQYS